MRVTIVLLLAASVGLGAIPDWDRGHLPGLTAVLLFAAICLTAYALIIPPLLRERFRRVIEGFSRRF
ncbi:MAG: hypothetical protein H5U19_09655 [Rhodobacteraceae bacterium]|nr:hypothetical protein [Paracoccaceae bacterium]